MPTAGAAYANTTVICATNGGNQQSFQVSWNNSNQFFADKGYIPRLYCEGGYAGNYRVYVSDTLNGGPLGYFNGITPTPVPAPEPLPSPSPTVTETPTVVNTPVVETVTPVVPVDTPTASVDTPTVSGNTDTSTQTSETTTTNSDTSTSTPDTATVVAPVDGSTATSQPAPEPAPIPAPPPVVQPEPEPVVIPDPPVEPTPEPEPVVKPTLVEEPKVPVVELEVVPVEEPKEENVVLDNGVVLTQEQATAVALLQNPGELLQELFTNPAAALAALGSVGADMTPEVRKKSEKVIISAVIAGNIATQAAASAAAVASYRRKP